MFDGNQENPFITNPSSLCNKPSDKSASSTSDLFPTLSSDPFSDDPFSPLNDQSDSVFSSNNESDLSSFLLNGPDSSEDPSPKSQQFSKPFDAQLSNESPNKQVHQLPISDLNDNTNSLFSQNPFLSISLNNPPIINGLYSSDPPVLCNGSNKQMALFETNPSASVQNGGLTALCPPPQNLKPRCARRREKVIV